MKRIVSLLLALATVMSLAACGKDPVASGSESSSGRRKLTIGIGNSSKITDYEDNYFTNFMEDYLDCDIEFSFFNSDTNERKRQLATMVAAQEKLPDILFGFSLNTDEIHIYGQDGYIMDLAPYFDDPDWELAKKYGWHEKMVEFVGEDTRRQALYSKRDANGAMYYWPGSCPSDTDRTLAMPFINTSWLDKLGLEMPTTWDELVEVLRAFRDKDPNGNGINDEIPMIGSTTLYCADAPSWIINNFGEYINDIYFYTYDENGKIQVPYVTDEYREGLRAMNALVEENLLTSLTWTIKEKAELASVWTPADGETTAGVIFGHPTTFTTAGDDDVFQYAALPPLEGSYVGVRSKSIASGTYITTDCEDFDLAAEFLMSFCDIDVARACRRGERGVDWEEEVEKKSGMPMVHVYNDVFSEPNNKVWAVNGPYVGWYGNGSPWSGGSYKEEEAEQTAKGYRGGMLGQIQTANLPYADEHNPSRLFFSTVYNLDEVEENGNRLTDIKTYMKEARAKFATGMWDIDDDTQWQNYLDTMEDMGLDILIKNTQAAVDREG